MPLEAADLANDPTIKGLMSTLTDVGKLVRGLVTIQQQQGAALTELRTKTAAAPNAHKEEEDEGDEEVDPDSLGQKEFHQFLMKQVGGLLDEKIGALGTKLDNTTTEFRNSKLTEEYTKLAGEHPDFDEWAEEMKALHKDHPTLGLKRLYNFAKSESPTKVKEMDAKYADKSVDGKGKSNEGLTLFGGFRPSIGKTGGDDAGKPAKLTPDQASSKAWDETVAKFPGLASLETSPLD